VFTGHTVTHMATPDETLAVLRRYADSWLAGDMDAVLAAYADDVVFHYFGNTDLAGAHVGKAAAVEAMVTVSARAPRRLVEVLDVLAGNQFGAIVAVEELNRDGESATVRRTFLYRVEAGTIVECRVFDEDQAQVDRFWRP
jgi:ketosteroid isomerase-like protein